MNFAAANHDIPDIPSRICNTREIAEGSGRPAGCWTGGRQAAQGSSLLDSKRAARARAWPAASSPGTWSPRPKYISSGVSPGRVPGEADRLDGEEESGSASNLSLKFGTIHGEDIGGDNGPRAAPNPADRSGTWNPKVTKQARVALLADEVTHSVVGGMATGGGRHGAS